MRFLSLCLSFLLLTVAVQSPVWADDAVPPTPQDAVAMADVRQGRVVCEAFFADHQRYPQDMAELQSAAGLKVQQGVEIAYKVKPDGQAYLLTANHQEGTLLYGVSSDFTDIKTASREQMEVYQLKAYNASAAADIRNARVCCEAYFADNYRYPRDRETLLSLGWLQLSDGVSLTYKAASDGQSYALGTYHEKGDTVYSTRSDITSIEEAKR